MNNDINAILSWSRENGLEINAGKTKVIIFSDGNCMSGITIEYVISVKDFGLTLENELNWNQQANSVRKELCYRLVNDWLGGGRFYFRISTTLHSVIFRWRMVECFIDDLFPIKYSVADSCYSVPLFFRILLTVAQFKVL